MRVVFLTGIWPPDVGGPATHGPDFAAFLRDRGHSVHVVTMGDNEPTERPVPVEWVTRSWPFPIRYSAVAATFNGPSAHFDLGAGGRGVTTDCHDASGADGGNVFGGPHCFTGTTLVGVSTGLQWRF